MKKWVRLAAILSCSVSAGWAVDWKELKPLGYVSDFAGVIDDSSKTQLDTYCRTLEQSTGVQLAIVTISSLEGEPIEDVANTIARAWGVGQKGANEGILLLLAIRDRRDRLEVGYGLEPILPDGMDGRILREMRPALRQQRYGEAVLAAADTLGQIISRAKNVPLNARLTRHLHPPLIEWIPIGLGGVGIILVVLAIYRSKRRGFPGGSAGAGSFQPWVASDIAQPAGSSTGGGFGSFDSADSCGGFGGGDFGGGGASSSW